MGTLGREEGRDLFGYDPGRYDRARAPYPDWIFDQLGRNGLIGPEINILELGPGSGIATRRLLDFGAARLTLVEPDERFAGALEELTRERGVDGRVLHATFEDAALVPGAFDLLTAATSFHWIDPSTGLVKARDVLRPRGAIALFWNVLQDLDREDAFHDATQHLFANQPIGPYDTGTRVPWPLERDKREAELEQAGFERIEYLESRWTWEIDAQQVRDLYESFSHVQRLAGKERADFLKALVAIAREQFDGRVARNVTSCLYLAWRPAGKRET